jgi:hypothetical protein
MKFAQIVFLQGEEANEVGEMLNDHGIDEALTYLRQWDMGEYHDVRDASSAVQDVFTREHREGPFFMSWNPYVGYFSLERLVADDYSPHP